MSDQTTTSPTDNAWRSRIVAAGDEDPQQLLANPKNWRIHPGHQQRALNAVLDRVGWVQTVIVNRTSGFVVDGHLRVALSITRGEKQVPVSYVELNDREEDLVLASLDTLPSLAVADPEALERIMAQDVDGELQKLFTPDDTSYANGNPASDYLPTEFGGDPGDYDADDAGRNYVVMCPECGEEFSVYVPV
jgi:hypothetical protein